MKLIYLVLTLLFTASVSFGDAVIFSGADVKALKFNLDLFGRSKVMGLNVDPSAGAGIAAPLGSIGMDYLTGNVYYKKTAPNTGWISISNAVEGTPFQYAAYDVNGILNDLPGISYIDSATQYFGAYYNQTLAGTLTEIRPGGTVDANVNGQTATDYSAFVARSNMGNAVATTVNNIQPFAWQGNFGANLTANFANSFVDSHTVQAGADVSDITSYAAYPTINQATMTQYKAFTSAGAFGNTDPSHLDGITGFSAFEQLGAQVDIDNYTGMNVSPNFTTGAVVDGYSSIQANPQFDVIGLNGYRGVQVGGNFGQNSATTVNNHIDFQSSPVYRVNATLGSYNGLSIGAQFEEGSTIDNATAIYTNLDVRGDVVNGVTGINTNNNIGDGTAPLALTSYQDLNLNPNFGANLTLDDYTGIALAPNVQPGASITNNVNLMNLQINSAIPVGGSATGLSVNMQNFQTPAMPTAISAQNGSSNLFANFDTGIYPVQSLGGPYGLNFIGGNLHIASGFPITGGNFGIGNNLGISILAEDDIPVDSSGLRLGFLMNGFLTQVGIAAGKTMDSLTFMGAGAQDAVPGGSTGTFSQVIMFRALGMLPTNGASVTDMYGFKVEPTLTAMSPTNAWGVWVGDTNADNWFAKNVVIGGVTGKPTFAGVGLDVNGAVIIQDQINDNANVNSVDTNVRELYDASGVLRFNWNGTALISDATAIRLDANGGNAQSIQFFDSTNTNSTTLRAAATTTASVTYDLPPDDGAAGDVLTTDGAGVMTWQTPGAGTYTPPKVTVYTTPGIATHTFTGTPLYVKVQMVGGGGGGAGSDNAGTLATSGGGGGSSRFAIGAASESEVNGGGGGIAPGAQQGGQGGLYTIGAGVQGFGVKGGDGASSTATPALGVLFVGGIGASSHFGGGGGGGYNTSGFNGAANSGSGGGGGGSTATGYCGSGGAAGGYADLIYSGATLAALGATADYEVGAAGTNGVGNTGGYDGGDGGEGLVVVTEYYQ